jgi:hypothetical protein
VAWLKTIAVRLGLLMLLQLGASPGKTFIVRTDNTTTFSTILRRKSKDAGANAEWKIIQQLLLDSEIDLFAQRVTSAENKADGLSRGKGENHHRSNRIVITMPVDLAEFFTQT